jgi:hypothetical protein
MLRFNMGHAVNEAYFLLCIHLINIVILATSKCYTLNNVSFIASNGPRHWFPHLILFVLCSSTDKTLAD